MNKFIKSMAIGFGISLAALSASCATAANSGEASEPSVKRE